MKFKFCKPRRRNGLAILGGSLVFMGAAHGAALFMEDFEGLALGASPEEDPASTDVWTQTPPAGWTADNSGVPGFGDPAQDGVSDWAGWSFANKDWWIGVAGNQSRDSFTRGVGTVMVMDPDEWDDDTNPGGGLSTFIQTPVIDVSSVPLTSLAVNFDSSFRPYAAMTGLVDLSFDGGATFVNALTLDTASLGGNSVLDRANSAESLLAGVDFTPTGTDLVVRFGMTDAGNDWWWAVDNVSVTPEPSTGLLGALGLFTLASRRRRSS